MSEKQKKIESFLSQNVYKKIQRFNNLHSRTKNILDSKGNVDMAKVREVSKFFKTSDSL